MKVRPSGASEMSSYQSLYPYGYARVPPFLDTARADFNFETRFDMGAAGHHKE